MVSASAESIELVATLSGANEVPPIESGAHGSAIVTVDTVSRTIRWTVEVEGLSAPLSAAHFHGPGTASQNAGLALPFAKKGDRSPFVGSATLDAEKLSDLLDGYWYVNVHTPSHPPGEVRGQLVQK